MIPAVAGVGIGVAAQQRIPERAVSAALRRAPDRRRRRAGHPLMDVVLAILLALAGGAVGGLLGVGGGILFVPALAVFLGTTQLEAEATSLLVIVPMAIIGTWRQHRHGNVDLREGATIGLLSVPGVVVGVVVANALPQRALELGFAALCLLVAVRLLRRSPAGQRRPRSTRPSEERDERRHRHRPRDRDPDRGDRAAREPLGRSRRPARQQDRLADRGELRRPRLAVAERAAQGPDRGPPRPPGDGGLAGHARAGAQPRDRGRAAARDGSPTPPPPASTGGRPGPAAPLARNGCRRSAGSRSASGNVAAPPPTTSRSRRKVAPYAESNLDLAARSSGAISGRARARP